MVAFAAGLLISIVRLTVATEQSFQAQIEADWAAQEKRLGRSPEQPEAIRAALDRADKLLGDLRTHSKRAGLESEAAALRRLREKSSDTTSLVASVRPGLYNEVRWATRELAFKNPLITRQPLAFMKRNRFVCQMLHEYLGYFYDYGDVAPGGGVFVLEEPGRSFKTRDLIGGRLPPGNFATMAVTYDARTIYFAFAERARKKPDFYSTDRRVRELRVFQVLPKTESHIANDPRLGYANAESARLLLGTVPVEADGSAYFRVPARKPEYFQVVDDEGRAIQTMRRVTYLQPGERRSRIGCHEGPNTAPAATAPLATRRPASRLQPGPDGSRPMSYPRLIQPILDRHCTVCHDGSKAPGKSKLPLTSEPTKHFTRSYDNLKPFVRWYEWGGASISQITTRPGHAGADESPLTRILSDAAHAPINLPGDERRRIYLWLEANAPFYGTYEKAAHVAQRNGEAVPPPQAQ